MFPLRRVRVPPPLQGGHAACQAVSAVLFETERLRCRRWGDDELAALMAVYGDPINVRWVGDGQPLTREKCEQWQQVTAANYQRHGYGMFALESRDNGAAVGFCGLVHPGGQPDPEVKYALLRSHWGQGLASEVVPRLVAYGHRVLGLERMIATVAPEHLASQRVLRKAGMSLAGQRLHDDGGWTLVFEWQGGAGRETVF